MLAIILFSEQTEWTPLGIHLKFYFETLKGLSSVRYAVVLPNKCHKENSILFAPFSWHDLFFWAHFSN